MLDAPATPEKILMSLKELKSRTSYNKNWEQHDIKK
jgi:xanthine dehydrogenase molybdopterin-binding subunit B